MTRALWDWSSGLADDSPFNPGAYSVESELGEPRAVARMVTTELSDTEVDTLTLWELRLDELRHRESLRVGLARAGHRDHSERVSYHNERAFRRGTRAALTLTDWFRIVEWFGGLCAYCASRPGSQLEHVIPIARGGSTEPSNVVAACGPCNRSKGASDPLEWLESRGFLSGFVSRCLEGAQ